MREIGERQRDYETIPAISMVLLMLLSTQLLVLANWDHEDEEKGLIVVPKRTAYQQQFQFSGPVQGENQNQPASTFPFQEAYFQNPFYNDPAAFYGKVSDPSALGLGPQYGFFLEETNTDDHDNDGIDDLNDLDDDNDGINDLIERFDGCYGTYPLDHDNDGILDRDDWDDDNDGILEGPIDYSQGTDPWNVTSDRHVDPNAIHPWTGQAVGFNYLVDQNPMDHDNDGIPDEDIDGPGRGTYDEDDDNDGRIDQFYWPCDFDSDGLQDYFDDDDDDDGLADILDIHPWDPDQDSRIDLEPGILWDDWTIWDNTDYSQYVDGLDYVALEALLHPREQSFTTIYDGDLDGDGIPNFLDPDNDNDGSPDSSDTDDDNDGLADMYDVDDDNDGIPDTCRQVDTNGDGQGDYPIDVVEFGTPGTDCELDYDGDLDDDRFRPIDQDYDLVWDWLDTDMGGTPSPDNPSLAGSGGATPWDLDDDGLLNEEDPYPLNATSEVVTWDCASVENPNPQDPSINCVLWRTSYTGFNDWDGDGVNNWVDVDDDNDGILDWMDIDPDCDLDNDADLHELNGSMFRDDGPNDIDTDVDGDGLANDEDWDDDNDGINDYYDPDDGNCGVVDVDNTDQFYGNSWPQGDGDAIDGTEDGAAYVQVDHYYWNMTWGFNPFNDGNGFMLDYNGYDDALFPPVGGKVPEMYWFLMMKWSPYNGINFFDIDIDGDSLINGIDVDQDGDGLPDWWDQDEGNDGVLDVDDVKMGGTLDGNSCGTIIASAVQERFCGLDYAFLFGYPLMPATQSNNQIFTVPYSSRPDSEHDDGSYDGSNHPQDLYACESNCFWFTFDPGSNPAPSVAVTYNDIRNNRDLWIAYIGLNRGLFQWTADPNANLFPDEVADELNDDVDPDIDCGQPMPEVSWVPTCMYNNTNDLDDDWDIVYDHFDVDDDNDGVWDYFEVDSNDDLDDDASIDEPYYFTGENCVDMDDDGLDTDPDLDGIYQSVWDRGVMGQGLLFPEYYDVDNDNDGVPDGEDPDDDNNGILDSAQEAFEGCFVGEEQRTWDHDNDGVVNWADDDWDGDGIPNSLELLNLVHQNGTADPSDDTCCLNFPIAPWDHDNDGIRDDFDDDDDYDGMKDEDEVMLWPSRFGLESTNPWDHDDFGGGVAAANPTNNTTGPDYYDVDDDNDGRADLDWNNPFSMDGWANPSNKTEEFDGGSSDWDSDNDGILDNDDKIPTRITLTTQPTLWIDQNRPAIFNGSVFWLGDTGFVPAPDVPVQVHIRYIANGTSVIETIDVLTDALGEFIVGQFLFPEDISVGPNTTYEVYAEVTEMFVHDYSSTLTDSNGDGIGDAGFPVEVRANTTIGYVSGQRFRADEQPLKMDFKVHYTADYERGIFDNRIPFAPVSFTISDSGTQFGNITHPTVYDGYGNGYRADSGGWVSLAYNQSGDVWEQVRWNSLLDNGPGIPTGGYEEIVWNPCGILNPIGAHSPQGPYDYKNTTLPTGDYSFVGFSRPDLGKCSEEMGYDPYEWPWPHLEGSKTDTFYIRAMHRMYIEAELFAASFRPVYFWDSTQFTGSSFGAWRALFHAPSLANAGLEYSEASLGKPYPLLWDGTPSGLTGIAGGALTPFLSSDGTDWTITMQNSADFDSPPCGPVDPLVPNSPVRCEIVPEMFTGEIYRVVANVWNRTFSPWLNDSVALQVDGDRNGIFAGSKETLRVGYPVSNITDTGERIAIFEEVGQWTNQFTAGHFGIRVDFTANDYYFTGDQEEVLAATGAYNNISVIGTTSFELNTVPRLYRGQNATIEARLTDNAYQPVREVPVNWTWSEDSTSGIAITDNNGIFKVNLTDIDTLGNFTLDFTYLGDEFRQGSSANIALWVVSRTFINVQSTSPNLRSSGDLWEFNAMVTDDNMTPFEKDGGQVLNSCAGEMQNPDGYDLGGNVTVIFEGIDFEDRTHRQVVSLECPASGSFSYGRILDPQLLRDDPYSFLPDGFGPVNVILRFEENLPHEGCEPLDAAMLATSGAWDPCVIIQNSDHFRKVLQFQVDGFSLIGRTTLKVDDQIVYTSEIDPNTGQAIEKPMIVTGQLVDELGGNLSSRAIRVTYEMDTGDKGVTACIPGVSDENGFFDIVCPLSGVDAGQAKVRIEYNSFENNDRFRYHNASVTKFFPVFSNSTVDISEIGPFRSDYLTYTFPNGSTFEVLYLKEAFHIDARLTQTNGKPIGGKCLNIYLDPLVNTRPFATAITTDGTGEFEWYSADPDDNPSRRGVEPSGNKLEGFRTIRVAYEPDKEIPGGCRAEDNPVLNSSFMDIEVLVRSKVDILLKEHWYNPSGFQVGDPIAGEVAILRDRLDLTVEGQRVEFIRQYWNGSGWQTAPGGVEILTTNERGSANFSFIYPGEEVFGEGSEVIAVDGRWRVLVHFESADDNRPYFVERWLNSTPEIKLGDTVVDSKATFLSTQVLVVSGIALSSLLLVGMMMYNNYRERRKVEVLRGILTDSLMSLKASNNYIETIFKCYKDLIKYFRMRGAMKKVFETTREFEDVIVNMLGGVVPPEELNMFFSIFEEARYSDHEIGTEQRDGAIQIFQSMISRMNTSLGDTMLNRTSSNESSLYGPSIKAGQFVDAEGQVRYAGVDDSVDDDGFRI